MSRHLGSFDADALRRRPALPPLETVAGQIAGLAVTCAMLLIVAFVVGAL